MCVAENTLRGVSVELSAISGQLSAERSEAFSKKWQGHFFDILRLMCGGTGVIIIHQKVNARAVALKPQRLVIAVQKALIHGV